jgi:hypothetical protein
VNGANLTRNELRSAVRVRSSALFFTRKTTLAQEELPKDTEVLRALTRHNRVQVGAAGLFPCAGVYAVVEEPGTMRVGDRVALPGSEVDSEQTPGPLQEHPPT